ncbi:hypothetical protein Tco_1430026 [Tanacetum coccineum]
MKLLRHLWNIHKGISCSLKWISLRSDDVMIKALLLLYQILIQLRKEDMTLALQAHHSLQLHSHLPGSQPTLEMLLQAPPIYLIQRVMTLTIEDIPMPETANLSDLEGNNSDHLPKTKQRPEWLKPIPDDERPATLEPA